MKEIIVLTIGYQKMAFEALEAAMCDIDLLVDVRSRPHGRAHQFNRGKLEVAFSGRYVWKGDIMGGFGDITNEAIEELAELAKQQRILLMCFERDPATCHRHYELALRLMPHDIQTFHLLDGKRIPAEDLIDHQKELF